METHRIQIKGTLRFSRTSIFLRKTVIAVGAEVLRAFATWNDKWQPKERPTQQNQNNYRDKGASIGRVTDSRANLLMAVGAGCGTGFTGLSE